ncbi:MAG: class I SAM-dependent methyltransferase [Desulfovibrionaceae bacterium]
MNDTANQKVECFYRDLYQTQGEKAQRAYPNEELCRFIFGTFGHLPREERAKTRLLEVGVGVGGNLWMLTWEGFDVTGLDICSQALELSRDTISRRCCPPATLVEGNILNPPLEKGSFDAVIDIYCTHHLPFAQHVEAYSSIERLLKPGGRFFSFHPGTGSDAFRHCTEERIDAQTLCEIQRDRSPYSGNPVFCFLSIPQAQKMLQEVGLELEQHELAMRTYHQGEEHFETLVLTARKPLEPCAREGKCGE